MLVNKKKRPRSVVVSKGAMPLGKYKGQDIDNVADEDSQYLRWLLENADLDRYEGLFENIREILRRKGQLNE